MGIKQIMACRYIVNKYGALFTLSKDIEDVEIGNLLNKLFERNFYLFETLEDSIKKQSKVLNIDEETLKKVEVPLLFVAPHGNWCILFDKKIIDVGEKDIGIVLENYHFGKNEFY